LLINEAPEPRCAADTAGAVPGLGAIHPAHGYGLLATRQPATFRRPVQPIVNWRFTGQPHAVCLATASPLRPPPFKRLPAAQLTAVRSAA